MNEKIKEIRAKARQEYDVGLKEVTENNTNPNSVNYFERKPCELIDQIKRSNVIGNKRVLIRLDDKFISLLGQLKPVFGLDITQFINYAIADFLETKPEIKTEIKNKLKNITI